MTVLARLTALVAAEATGVVWIYTGVDGARLRLELVRGWVHAIASVALPAGPDELAAASRARAGDGAAALTARLAAILARDGATLAEGDEARARIGAVTPFHPLGPLRAIVRQALATLAVESRDEASRPSWEGRLHDEAALFVGKALHDSGVDPDERRALELLGRRPLALAELRRQAGVPPTRLDALLREIGALGLMHVDGAAFVIDVFADAGAAQLRAKDRKRAYHAAARELHPDLHPSKDPAAMAELAAKHRRGE